MAAVSPSFEHRQHDHRRCAADALRHAEIISSREGLRLTEQRRKVLEALLESHVPASAYDVIDRLAEKERHAAASGGAGAAGGPGDARARGSHAASRDDAGTANAGGRKARPDDGGTAAAGARKARQTGGARRLAPISVYRALDFLTEHRFAHRIESKNAYVACDRGEDCAADATLFLICDNCGAAGEASSDALASLINAETRHAGFLPRLRVLEVRGLCATCKAG